MHPTLSTCIKCMAIAIRHSRGYIVILEGLECIAGGAFSAHRVEIRESHVMPSEHLRLKNMMKFTWKVSSTFGLSLF